MQKVNREKVNIDPLFNPGDVFKTAPSEINTETKAQVPKTDEILSLQDFLESPRLVQSPRPPLSTFLTPHIILATPLPHAAISTPTTSTASSIPTSNFNAHPSSSTSLFPLEPATTTAPTSGSKNMNNEHKKAIHNIMEQPRTKSNVFDDETEVDFSIKASPTNNDKIQLDSLFGAQTKSNRNKERDNLFSSDIDVGDNLVVALRSQNQGLQGVFIPNEAVKHRESTEKTVNTGLDKDLLDIPTLEMDQFSKNKAITATTSSSKLADATETKTTAPTAKAPPKEENLDDDLFELIDTKNNKVNGDENFDFTAYINKNKGADKGGLFS